MAQPHGIDLSKLPKIIDVTPETITGHVHAINSSCPDERTKFIFKNLVTHLHDFVRETSITSEEWMTAIQFLTRTGKTCTDLRQEFILLSDTLGVSALIDTINNTKPPGATEATVLGPFFTEDTHHISNGDSIASEGKGDYLFVEGRVLDTKGNPIPGAIINTWETDAEGIYDTQHADREEPDCRGRLVSAKDGSYSFRGILPVSYSIPDDGPVSDMLATLGRHLFRPSHLHLMVEAPGFEKLITAVYFEGDPYLTNDAVFGVRKSLIIKPLTIDDPSITQARGFKEAKPHAYLKQDLVLATPEECAATRKARQHGASV